MQVLKALQSVGPSLRQASIAEAMQDEDKRLSWMNKLVGNAYQLARTTEEEEEEEEERGDVHENQLEVFFNPLSAFRCVIYLADHHEEAVSLLHNVHITHNRCK